VRWVVASLVLISTQVFSAEATLEIVAGQQRLVFSQPQLLARGDVETISVPDSEYRRRFTRFKAIPIAHLFAGVDVPELAVVQCNASDGFSANLEKSRLFSTDPKASKAYLAIEDPKRPWPRLSEKTASAGPFYLVWTNPDASGIGSEEWPYRIASFRVLSDPKGVFPKIYPAADASPAVQNGFRSFQKNCFACHTMNGNGAGSIGPDLNLPMNPTEYLQAAALVALIRDPASLRTWPQRRMRGFSEAALSDSELADLIAYLQHMSTRKVLP
jgi:mono/diheme cytochrome c family protein